MLWQHLHKSILQHVPKALGQTWPVIVSSFFLMAAFGCVPPALTLQGEALGWAASDIGLLFTFAVVGRIFSLFVGPYIIRHVGLNTFIPVVFALTTIALSLPAFGPEVYNLWLGHEVLRGLMLGPIYVIFDLWIYAKTRDSEMGRIFTLYFLAAFGGYAIGPMIIAQTGVSNMGFGLCIGLSILAALPILLNKVPRMHITPPTFGNLREIVRGNGFLWIVCIIAGYASEAVVDFLGIFGLDNGMTEGNALVLMSWFVAGGLVMQYPLATLMDKSDKGTFTLYTMAFGALAAAALAMASASGVGIVCAVFVMGALCSLMGVTGSTLLGERFNAGQLMLATTMLNICYDTGSLVGPMFNGLMIDALGNLGLPTAIAIVFGGGAVCALLARERKGAYTGDETILLTEDELRIIWAKIHAWTDNSMYIHARLTAIRLTNIARTPCVRMKWIYDS